MVHFISTFFYRFLPFHSIDYVLESMYSGISPEYWFRYMSNCYCPVSWHSCNSPNYRILGIFGREHKLCPSFYPRSVWWLAHDLHETDCLWVAPRGVTELSYSSLREPIMHILPKWCHIGNCFWLESWWKYLHCRNRRMLQIINIFQTASCQTYTSTPLDIFLM